MYRDHLAQFNDAECLRRASDSALESEDESDEGRGNAARQSFEALGEFGSSNMGEDRRIRVKISNERRMPSYLKIGLLRG